MQLMNDFSSVEKYLKENGTLTYTFKGCSMNPLLKQGRDLFTVVSKTPERCKKYDVVLYRKSASQYVLHRIVEVRDHDYVVQGDNCITKEYGIRDDDIIGVMTSFKHKNKIYSVTDKKYLLYVYVWAAIHPHITFLRQSKSKIRRGPR